MKSFLTNLAAVAASVAVIAFSAKPTAAVESSAETWVRLLDANGDGAVSKNEMKVHRLAAFSSWDRNGDGFINQKDQGAETVSSSALANFIMVHDADNDGAVSSEELSAGPLPTFDHFDRNRDGFLTGRELRAFVNAARVRRPAPSFQKKSSPSS